MAQTPFIGRFPLFRNFYKVVTSRDYFVITNTLKPIN